MHDFYISTEELAVGYGGQPLIENIRLGLNKGQIMTLIGPNGAGKSTILKTMTRQLRPIAGTVWLDGRALTHMTEKEVSQKLSLVLTDHLRPELMTCRDVVATGRYPYTGRLGILSPRDHEIVRNCLARVHAEDLADRDFSRISDGQRQRVLLARALCQEPEIIVLDEPTSFLDIRHKLELLSLLKDMMREKDLAVLMSLHELDLAQRVSDIVVCVHGDRIERFGPPEEIFTNRHIAALYDLEKGTYNAHFGCLEMPPALGAPKVFVIGGGGSGIPLYRKLQRQGIPFAAGILWENDVDHHVAAALAGEVVSVPAFAPMDDTALSQAMDLMQRCEKVLCPLSQFGPLNEANHRLKENAQALGLLAEDTE